MADHFFPPQESVKGLRRHLILYVNGQKKILTDAQPEMTLLEYLRSIGLTGTKLGCGEGGCGACTVAVAFFDAKSMNVVHRSVNACLAPLCSMDLCAITTVEGLGNMRDGLHPVQKRIAEFHGSQCGFCTPGIVMSLYSTLQNNPSPTLSDIEHSFDGNLCRCTGYRPILDAAKTFAVDKSQSCAVCPGRGCCSKVGDIEDVDFISCTATKLQNFRLNGKEYENLAPCFPQELLDTPASPLCIEGKIVSWHRPISLHELLLLKAKHSNAKIIAGNTEIGIETKFKNMKYPTMISISHITELHEMKIINNGVHIGAGVTLTNLSHFIEDMTKTATTDSFKFRSLSAIHMMLEWFASTQIRNVAVVGGNLATASPIADLNPMLMAANSVLTIASLEKSRTVPVSDFFLSYRKVDLQPEEVITSIFVPFTNRYEFILPYKQAKRRDDDISIVTAGIRVHLEPSNDCWTIVDASLAFGGMAPTTVGAKGTMAFLKGKTWDETTLENAYDQLHKDMNLPPNVPGGMPEFRMSLCSSFLFKFFTATSIMLERFCDEEKDSLLPKAPLIAARDRSAATSFVTKSRDISSGIQTFGKEKGDLQHALPRPHAPDMDAGEERAPVGEPLMHKSAYAQVSGEAVYTDDIAPLPGTLYAALVLSSIPRGKILSVDASLALQLDGVHGFFSANDVTGSNAIGDVVQDEEVFLTSEVFAVGQPIGIIAAKSSAIAQEAAKLVKVEYEEIPAICTIDQAIEANSYYYSPHVLEKGDIERGFAEADVIVEGEMRMGGQEHFYLETNATYCVPEEQDGMIVYSSTQNPCHTQTHVAHVIGVPSHKVVCRMKRMGGGFGGKESRSIFISCAVAIAAHHLKKPVKLSLDRDIDMCTTGARHAFVGKYRVGARKNGKLVAADLQIYGNAGYSLDLSMPVVDRALFHCENAYFIPNIRAVGRICKTNISSNTAFRGFGGPQGMAICEAYMDHLAREIGISGEEIRGINLYHDGDVTPYGQKIEFCTLQHLWDTTMEQAQVEERKRSIEEFNKNNKWRKRGICVMPTKFGINFTAKFMNQGGALVHVYTDGSVLVSHGGTEMGQGLHTKVIQIAARSFNISDAQVTVNDTATDKVPNSSPSAASMSTDLYGMAVLDACEQIKLRLAPIAEKMPGAPFSAIVQTAYFQRINLSAQGFYVVPHERCGYDWDMKTNDNSLRGHPFNYYTTGVACTEIELDALTGDFEMVRTDIFMDVGKSINPAIDVGQIEGAFVQGFGLFTMEELVWGDEQHKWVRPGQLFTRGPGTYKIPSFNDVPLDFRVSLLKNAPNPFAVHSSKAVGEPPLFLGSSALFAVKNAIAAIRQEHGIEGPFQFNSPATSERIRVACADKFVSRCTNGDPSFQVKGSW